MRTGTLSIDEFAELVRPLRQLAVRLALYRHDDRWMVGLMDAHAGPSHRLPMWRKHSYRRFVFLAGRIPGEQVAEWITREQGDLNGVEFSFPPMTNVNWQQKTSQPGWALVEIRRPFTEYAVYGSGRLADITGLEVAGATRPYFRDWRLACLALLFDSWDSIQNTNLPTEVCTLRIESPGPWLDNIHVGAATLQVTIGGAVARAARLQIISPAGVLGNFAVTSRKRAFDVAAALPAGSTQVVLLRGDDVLDIRTVSMTSLGPQRVQEEGVTSDVPSRTESFESRVAGGEGPTTEFKEDLPKEEKKIPVAVSAFANTAGGAIFVGVDNHGNISGIRDDRVAQLADTIINQLRQKLRPFPPVTTETTLVDGKTVIVLWVEAVQGDPIGVGDAPVAYYVRRGANNFHATPEEIGALVRARSTPLSPYGPFGRL